MAFFDRFRKKAGREKLERPPKGAFKRPASVPLKAELQRGKPEKAEKKSETESVSKESGTKEKSSELASLLVSKPHITEKSTSLNEKSVYVFKVSPRANKILMKRAIKELYGLIPRKVRVLNMPSKSRFIRGKSGVKSGYKKAVVYLNKGDKIDLA